MAGGCCFYTLIDMKDEKLKLAQLLMEKANIKAGGNGSPYAAIKCAKSREQICNYAIGYPYMFDNLKVYYSIERGYRTQKELLAGVQEFINEHKK